MSATTRARDTGGRTNVDGVELARYTVPEGERILLGRRVQGGVAIVVDVPAGETGIVYLVERGVEQDGNSALQALLDDYRGVAERLQAVPMAGSPVTRYRRHVS
ncbi:MAG: hypothetical protein ACRET5_06135 [Steroidobacteraceae bacterium]